MLRRARAGGDVKVTRLCGGWTIVGPIIAPIALIWPYMRMRHCRNLQQQEHMRQQIQSWLVPIDPADAASGAVTLISERR
jgi:hypothetical protein